MILPRFVISAVRGGAGKTVNTIGIIAALARRNLSVAPYKKGPDYIDAGWLALAAGRPCFNLDTYLASPAAMADSFFHRCTHADIAVIEGNRGLYDGIDVHGSTSTAELAKQFSAPVILCIDCTKTTRTMAAVVMGLKAFDPDTDIKGVIVNRIAGARHESVLRANIEHYCGVPVIGAVPKLPKQHFPERHMGLIPTPEHSWASDSIAAAADVSEKYIDIDAVLDIARTAPPLESRECSPPPVSGPAPPDAPLIGVVRDSAFIFYYPENIEAIEAAGARVIFISPLSMERIPAVDGIYIGGGFPETHAEPLAQNTGFREDLKALAEAGMPIYAECGGLMYLGNSLELKDGSYPMAGVLPVVYGFFKKPQGHGYTQVKVEGENPYFTRGTRLNGHEFHYSRVLSYTGEESALVYAMERGAGLWNGRDGLCHKNVLATYTHIHALGAPQWAPALVSAAKRFQRSRMSEQ